MWRPQSHFTYFRLLLFKCFERQNPPSNVIKFSLYRIYCHVNIVCMCHPSQLPQIKSFHRHIVLMIMCCTQSPTPSFFKKCNNIFGWSWYLFPQTNNIPRHLSNETDFSPTHTTKYSSMKLEARIRINKQILLWFAHRHVTVSWYHI